ncbi:MAG: ABC transporter ATP-binding protein [Candidatus Syntrophoarchaeum sp.]|nr:ABC transporter ATP-binding protein [Methanomicrobia archaeon]MBL7118218.1 ABC transporter ATP-binding protein [Candidatus Syntrophoarchaeum sp.]
MKVVELVEVTKVYELPRGSIKALDNVTASIEAGEFISVMGPSGSGKTTLLNIIGCLDVPTSGEVIIGNEKVNGLSDDELTKIRRDKIGFVFQQFNLIPTLTALENVEYPMILKGVNGHEKRSKGFLRSVGLDEQLGENKPNELSGGEQQRVAIARALANDPDIILADEPTGNLDSKTSKDIMQLLKATNERGKTIIVVTHDPLVAGYTSRTFRLVDGRVM